MTRTTLRWRVRDRMRILGIQSVAELQRRLAKAGTTLSKVQVGRTVERLPAKLDTGLLAALCDVLHCGPGDLLTPVATQPQAPTSEAPPPPNATVLSAETLAKAVGPTAASLAPHVLARGGGAS